MHDILIYYITFLIGCQLKIAFHIPPLLDLRHFAEKHVNRVKSVEIAVFV